MVSVCRLVAQSREFRFYRRRLIEYTRRELNRIWQQVDS